MLGLLSQQKPQSADAAILTVSDRLTHSTMLEDRKAAALALRGFSHENREFVASSALRGIIGALESDRDDREMRRTLLETLVILLTKSTNADVDLVESSRRARRKDKRYVSPLLLSRIRRAGKSTHRNGVSEASSEGILEASGDDISLWMTDELVQREDTVRNLLEFVTSKDTFTSLYALQIVSALVINRADRVRQSILAARNGISVLVGSLSSANDMIRDEAILLLIDLSQANMNFQNLVAFEGGFDKLFDIIVEEGGVLYGGPTVQSCLELMSHLLKYNVANQKLFVESNCAPRFAQMLQTPEDAKSWNETASANMTESLHVARIFMVPGAEAVRYNQNAFAAADVLSGCLRLALALSTPIPIRVAALLTTASIVYDNTQQQDAICDIDVPYYDLGSAANLQREPEIMPVTQALLNWALLLMSANLFDLRAASFLVLTAIFKGNLSLKSGFLNDQFATYNVAAASIVNKTSANIISSLVEYDEDLKLNPFQVWFAAAILMHLFNEAPSVKDEARTLKIGDTTHGEEELTLLQALAGQLQTALNHDEPTIAISYLMLLTVWLFDDVAAVHDLTKESTLVQSLVTYLIGHNGATGSMLLESLITVLLGVAYDFSSLDSGLPRADLYKLLISSMGRDQFMLQIQRFRDSPELKDFYPSSLFGARKGAHGLPAVTLEAAYVTLVSENINRIQGALDKDPNMEPSSRVSLEMYEELKMQLHEETLARSEYQQLKETEIRELTEATGLLRSKLKVSDESLSELESTMKDMQAQYAKSTGELKKINSDFIASVAKNSRLTDELSKSQDATKSALADLQNLTLTYEKLKSQSELAIAAKEKAENGVNKLTRELFTAQGSQKDLQRETVRLKSELEDKERKLKGCLQTESQLKEDIDKLEASLGSEQKALDQSKQINDRLIEKLRETAGLLKEKEMEDEEHGKAVEQAQMLQTQLDTLTSKYELAEKEKNLSRAKVEKLLGEKAALLSSNSKLESTQNELLSKIQELETEVKKLKGDADVLEFKRNESEIKHQNYLERLELQASALRDLEEKYRALETKHQEQALSTKERESELKDLREKSKQDTKLRTHKLSSVNKAEGNVAEQDPTTKALNEELKKLKEVVKNNLTEIADLRSEGDRKVASLEKTIKELEEKSSDMDEFVLLLDDVTEKKNKYKSKLRALNESISDSDDSDISEGTE